MPAPTTILSGNAAIANEWWVLAVAWHVVFGALVLAVIRGWRPLRHLAGYLLAMPLLSVGALAWVSGNPFNGTTFTVLGLALIGVASRFQKLPIEIGSRLEVTAGGLLLAFAWTYPHFLQTTHWLAYSYAAPLGLLPCPTLSAAIGATLALGALRSKPWSITLAAAGVIYGAIGVIVLSVALDYGLVAGAIALGAAAGGFTRRSVRANWRERTGWVPGDELIPDPLGTLTHAITIQRPRRDVWPWLAQMGAGSRGGWYSYDFLDNGRRSSAKRIVSALQHLAVGMIFPALPGSTEGFRLLAFDPERTLILGVIAPDSSLLVTWAFALEDHGPGATRLISRARGSRAYRFHRLPWWLTKCIVAVVHFIMERKQLLSIAKRVERSAETAATAA